MLDELVTSAIPDGAVQRYVEGLANLPPMTFYGVWIPSDEAQRAYLFAVLRDTVDLRRRQRWNRKRRRR